jgi:hypothetical protein
MTPQERATIRAFLIAVRNILGAVVEGRDQYIPEQLRNDLAASWEELQTAFEEADAWLEQAGPEDEEQLRQHGFTGAQLRFKVLNLFRGRRRAFRWWPSMRTLRELLSAADVALESLAALIPPVGAIKEFKQAVEHSLPQEEPPGHEDEFDKYDADYFKRHPRSSDSTNTKSGRRSPSEGKKP